MEGNCPRWSFMCLSFAGQRHKQLQDDMPSCDGPNGCIADVSSRYASNAAGIIHTRAVMYATSIRVERRDFGPWAVEVTWTRTTTPQQTWRSLVRSPAVPTLTRKQAVYLPSSPNFGVLRRQPPSRTSFWRGFWELIEGSSIVNSRIALAESRRRSEPHRSCQL
jgi:hypothetical protein